MNRKHMHVLMLLVIVGVLALGGSAQAACPEDDPDCTGGGGPVTITRTVRVVDSSQATLTGTGINCGVAGDDCTASYSYSSDVDAPVVTLTATGVPAGYTARIFKCTSTSVSSCGGAETQCGVGSCDVTINANYRVRMSVADETAPSTATVTGPSKVGPAVRHFTASATDGAGVVSYRFYLDGVDQGLFSPGSGYDAPVSSLSEGSHSLTARARDAAGNESTSLSAVKAFTVDRSTGATGVSTPPAYTQSLPSISFGVPGDVSSVVCTTSGGGGGGSTSSCTSPYAPQGAPTDGQYSVEIEVTDDVGNTATVSKTFTLDRGAPNLTVTSPANGAIIAAPFTPAMTGSDGFSDVTYDCKIDSGAFGSCTSLAPSDGAHTVTVRASDAAGNTAQQERGFTYDSQAPLVEITEGPAEGSVVYSHSLSFTFTINDLTAVSRSCSIDDGAFGTCTSDTGQSFSALSVGVHTFALRVVDSAGHITTVQRRFAVADPPPGTSTTPGTGGTTETTPTGATPVGIAKFARVAARWRRFGKLTRVEKLALSGVPKGTKVKVTCKGKGCAFKKVTLTGAGKTLDLAKRFKRRKLAPRTVITITVTNPTGTKRFVYTVRLHRNPSTAVK